MRLGAKDYDLRFFHDKRSLEKLGSDIATVHRQMSEELHKELMGPTLDMETTRLDELEQCGTYPIFKLPKVSNNQKWLSSVKMDPEWSILERFQTGPAWGKPEGPGSTVISSLRRRGSRDRE